MMVDVDIAPSYRHNAPSVPPDFRRIGTAGLLQECAQNHAHNESRNGALQHNTPAIAQRTTSFSRSVLELVAVFEKCWSCRARSPFPHYRFALKSGRGPRPFPMTPFSIVFSTSRATTARLQEVAALFGVIAAPACWLYGAIRQSGYRGSGLLARLAPVVPRNEALTTRLRHRG
jgi:hypothetical protein